jgi:hypothetical protein
MLGSLASTRQSLPRLLVVGLTFLSCSESPATRPQGSPVSLAIEFPAREAGSGTSAGTAQVDAIEVSVFALTSNGPGDLLTRTTIVIGEEQSEFEVTLDVSSAAGYRIQVAAMGERQRPGRTGTTTYGLQFLGISDVETGAFQREPVTIEMEDAVPLPTVRTEYDASEQRIDHLAWESISGATSYTARDSLGNEVRGFGSPSFQVPGGAAGYRFSTSFPGGVGSAFSEGLNLGAIPPIIRSLTPDSVPWGGSDFVLSVTGAFFQPGATVRWNEVRLSTSYLSSSSLTAIVPAGLIASPGTVLMNIENPDGQLSDTRTLE